MLLDLLSDLLTIVWNCGAELDREACNREIKLMGWGGGVGV